MARKDGFRKYVEAGSVLGQITKARSEEIVRDLVAAGEIPRAQAQKWVDEWVARSKKAGDGLVHLVRAEVASQLSNLSLEPEKLAGRVAEILKQSASTGRDVTKSAARAATRIGKRGAAKMSAPPTKAAKSAKSAPAKKAARSKAVGAAKTSRPAKAPTAKTKSVAKASSAKKKVAKKSGGRASS